MNACMLLPLGVAALLGAAAASAAESPVVYAPDVVGVDRLFMVALKVDPAAPDVKVTPPDGVTLVDRTRLPAKSDVRRFYFRAARAPLIPRPLPPPGGEGEPVAGVSPLPLVGEGSGVRGIRFALPAGEVVVPVEVWSFEDLRRFRTLKGTQLPRRWPLGEPLPALKEAQVFPTGAEARLPSPPGGRGVGGEGGGWLDVPDDTIWAMQPDSTLPRWHWVNIQFGCPVHGQEIYKVRPYYPWEKDTSIPWKWKIRCPIGGEEYPSNDFGAGDLTSGDFPDDGIGGGFVKDGKHYGFIAELAQIYVHQMLQVPTQCAAAYVSTGDTRYVHKALVAFCRIAVEYAYLATMTQHRHRNSVAQVERFGQGRFDEGPIFGAAGLTVYSIDQPGYQVSLAQAYDRIFPAIGKDAEILPYLRAKGFDVKTHEDVRRFIEENLMAVWMQAAMDGATASNAPFHQWGLAKMAEVLNYPRGADFMDWLYDGAGKMRVFVPNTYFRDGAPYESTGGYNGMHVSALGPIVDAVENQRRMRPEVYPEARYPSLSKSRRYHSVFDFAMDTVTIDRGFPNVGDTGGWPSYSKLPKTTWQNGGAAAFEHAYRLFRDPKFAWALARSRGWQPSGDFPFTREQIEQEAAKWPDDWNDRSSLHDGYGLAILRGGKGDDKRALWMNYGHNRGHSQDDTLDIGLQGFEGVLLSHMGYPRNWGYWEYAWSSHHVARQFPYQTMTAQAQYLVDAGPVHLTEARATSLSDPEGNWQRRTLALVDVGPGQFYGVDLYRIHGGGEHWWAFHGQEGEVTTGGLDLARQEKGTLAGPDVPYGDAAWLKANGCSLNHPYGWRGVMLPFAHLYNVARGQTAGPWWADWKLKTGDGLHLRLNVPIAEGTEVAICDGTSPAGANPYEMKWVMLHRKGEAPVKTQVMSVLEPYVGEPLIQEIRPLKLSGEDEAGFAPAACVVRTAARTDTLLASADPAVARTADGGIRFAGRFGFIAEQEGVPVTMTLVGGTELSKGGFTLRLDTPEYRARVSKVDRETDTVTISPAPPRLAAMVGACVYLTSAGRRSAYKVLEAKAVSGGAQVRLDLDSRIGTGKVSGAADHEVKTATAFELQGFRYYLGARVVNAERTAEYRVTEVSSGKAALVDKDAHPEATAERLAKEFPTGTWFEVYDYGVGDELVWPQWATVTRTGAGYAVASSGEASLVVPGGKRWDVAGR